MKEVLLLHVFQEDTDHFLNRLVAQSICQRKLSPLVEMNQAPFGPPLAQCPMRYLSHGVGLNRPITIGIPLMVAASSPLATVLKIII